MATPPTITTQTPPDCDDTHCLRCGYNLRGLPGDPIRCPECGHDNTVADLRLPPNVLERKLKDLCHAGEFAAMGILIGAAPLLAWTWNELRARVGPAAGFNIPITLRMGVVFMIIGLSIAWSQVRKFQTLCHGRWGWQQMLLRYCAYGVLPLVWLSAVCLVAAPLERYARFLVFAGRQVAVFAGGAAIVAWVHRRIGRDARWLVQGRNRTQDPQYEFDTEEDRELIRKALQERAERLRQKEELPDDLTLRLPSLSLRNQPDLAPRHQSELPPPGPPDPSSLRKPEQPT